MAGLSEVKKLLHYTAQADTCQNCRYYDTVGKCTVIEAHRFQTHPMGLCRKHRKVENV